MIMVKKIIISIVFTLLFFSQQVFADTVYLKNGNKLKGIITKETDTSVELKINPGAKVTFSKNDIKNIENHSDTRGASARCAQTF